MPPKTRAQKKAAKKFPNFFGPSTSLAVYEGNGRKQKKQPVPVVVIESLESSDVEQIDSPVTCTEKKKKEKNPVSSDESSRTTVIERKKTKTQPIPVSDENMDFVVAYVMKHSNFRQCLQESMRKYDITLTDETVFDNAKYRLLSQYQYPDRCYVPLYRYLRYRNVVHELYTNFMMDDPETRDQETVDEYNDVFKTYKITESFMDIRRNNLVHCWTEFYMKEKEEEMESTSGSKKVLKKLENYFCERFSKMQKTLDTLKTIETENIGKYITKEQLTYEILSYISTYNEVIRDQLADKFKGQNLEHSEVLHRQEFVRFLDRKIKKHVEFRFDWTLVTKNELKEHLQKCFESLPVVVQYYESTKVTDETRKLYFQSWLNLPRYRTNPESLWADNVFESGETFDLTEVQEPLESVMAAIHFTQPEQEPVEELYLDEKESTEVLKASVNPLKLATDGYKNPVNLEKWIENVIPSYSQCIMPPWTTEIPATPVEPEIDSQIYAEIPTQAPIGRLTDSEFYNCVSQQPSDSNPFSQPLTQPLASSTLVDLNVSSPIAACPFAAIDEVESDQKASTDESDLENVVIVSDVSAPETRVNNPKPDEIVIGNEPTIPTKQQPLVPFTWSIPKSRSLMSKTSSSHVPSPKQSVATSSHETESDEIPSPSYEPIEPIKKEKEHDTIYSSYSDDVQFVPLEVDEIVEIMESQAELGLLSPPSPTHYDVRTTTSKPPSQILQTFPSTQNDTRVAQPDSSERQKEQREIPILLAAGDSYGPRPIFDSQDESPVVNDEAQTNLQPEVEQPVQQVGAISTPPEITVQIHQKRPSPIFHAPKGHPAKKHWDGKPQQGQSGVQFDDDSEDSTTEPVAGKSSDHFQDTSIFNATNVKNLVQKQQDVEEEEVVLEEEDDFSENLVYPNCVREPREGLALVCIDIDEISMENDEVSVVINHQCFRVRFKNDDDIERITDFSVEKLKRLMVAGGKSNFKKLEPIDESNPFQVVIALIIDQPRISGLSLNLTHSPNPGETVNGTCFPTNFSESTTAQDQIDPVIQDLMRKANIKN